MEKKILFAGFGGQGILFSGKFIVYTGMLQGQDVSWLPSYGPEMRGGTANCSVIISDLPIGSPIVANPDVLVVMNLPSLDKYEEAVVPGGSIYIDSSLIGRKCVRSDVACHYIPATELAFENGLQGLANMIICGNIIKNENLCSSEILESAMKKVIPERKQQMFASNIKAVDMGYNFVAAGG